MLIEQGMVPGIALTIGLLSVCSVLVKSTQLTWRLDSNTGWDRIWESGGRLNKKDGLTRYAIPMLKIRRPNGRLIFNMEIAIRR